MRILIVEDEKDINRLIRSLLEEEHYSVDACFNGSEVLDSLSVTEYDALVMDIMMPVMDGLSVLKPMRQKGIQTPVLLLTAKDSIEYRVYGLDAGANDDGYYKYEGDIIYNQKEYEFEIDANTGTFLEWSEERR